MATRKFSILCLAGIIYLLDGDVLEGPEGQAGDLGLASAHNKLIIDFKTGGKNRIKAVFQEGQSGSDIWDRLEKKLVRKKEL